MSFYVNNIVSEDMFEEILADERIAIVRFGYAESPECQRLDRMLAALESTVGRYFAFSAYETKDVTQKIRKRYEISDETRCILVFFSQKKPVYVSFCRRPSYQVSEKFPTLDELFSLLIMVNQGITHRKKIINIYGTYFEGKRGGKKPEASEDYE
ncbi:U5 snRNP protein, DIM1 family [Nematocida major]|uniref:U5 snRNP protein, DIM1 family n=1 Tax=Nematocida major TaxID=1912982 RepID=UPI0020084C43|nr:U5 snRNP protein, DIM1 family [Nematocida major]KAH9385406.1 U5 snRNP protein, DIM1 family [Nematocida major]